MCDKEKKKELKKKKKERFSTLNHRISIGCNRRQKITRNRV